MQYWVIFQAGASGDGFVNLLEHASNAHLVDSGCYYKRWRVDSINIVNGTRYVKFYGPRWIDCPDGSHIYPFRTTIPHSKEFTLAEKYYNCVKNKHNIIMPAHPQYWDEVDQFKYASVVKTDCKLIHLYDPIATRVRSNFINKVAREQAAHGINIDDRSISDIEQVTANELTRPEYDIHIDINRVWQSWEYLNSCLTSIGLDLDKKHYDKYMTYINRIVQNKPKTS